MDREIEYLHMVYAHRNVFMKTAHKTLGAECGFFAMFMWVVKQLHFENSNVVMSLKFFYPEINL